MPSKKQDEKCIFKKSYFHHSEPKENKERGSCGNGRLLIHLYYSAVTGNRKQVLTGSSKSCEHKCR